MKYPLILFLLSCTLFLHAQSPVVKTANGKVEGAENTDKTVRIFKGIPFAAPPVGNLRWKAPKPARKWKGVRKCTSFSASPIQNTPVIPMAPIFPNGKVMIARREILWFWRKKRC